MLDLGIGNGREGESTEDPENSEPSWPTRRGDKPAWLRVKKICDMVAGDHYFGCDLDLELLDDFPNGVNEEFMEDATIEYVVIETHRRRFCVTVLNGPISNKDDINRSSVPVAEVNSGNETIFGLDRRSALWLELQENLHYARGYCMLIGFVEKYLGIVEQ